MARIGMTRTFQIALASSVKRARRCISDNRAYDALSQRLLLNRGRVRRSLLAL